MKIIFSTFFLMLLSGCLTLSGDYQLVAYDANGKNLYKNMAFTAQGSGIYTIRNALCKDNPNGIIIIKDQKTGKELEGESPYHCR